ALECAATAFEGTADRLQQHLIAEWLRQELNGSGLHRSNARSDVAVPADEDDWHIRPIDHDTFLKIQTADVREGDVEYHAARNQCSGTNKEFLRRREGLDLPTCRLNQQFQRLTHRNVVVDDENDRGGGRGAR